MKLFLTESSIRMVMPVTYEGKDAVAIVGESKSPVKSTVYLFADGKLKKLFSVDSNTVNYSSKGFYFLNPESKMLDMYTLDGEMIKSVDFLRENDSSEFIIWICHVGEKRIVYVSADNKLISYDFEKDHYFILGTDIQRVMHVDDEIEYFTYQSAIRNGAPETVVILRYDGETIDESPGDKLNSSYLYSNDGMVVYSTGGNVITYNVDRYIKTTFAIDGVLTSFSNGMAYLADEDKIRVLNLSMNNFFEVSLGKGIIGKKMLFTNDYIITYRKETFANTSDACRTSEIVFYFNPNELYQTKSKIEKCVSQSETLDFTPVNVIIEK